ncbi:hypothetical protein [Deefgea sp. CFH1-16]|uniref:hypothetical protein n=1 Tax=Deefgea sp. CFH1-16 TaxID=2675457 RepID=UPI0015F4569C|nr:hypothetical protein [Deefgea sp. CFH1-16]MBM5573458.1 hypothetical protein [Deefgea sp. CFH1-16]
MELNKLTRLLTPILIEGVLSARRSSYDRLIEKINLLEFVTNSVVVTTNEIVIELQILDLDLLYQLLAGEANQFLLASRVTYDRATQGQQENASWQIVEHYYAAYYAIHYLIRLTGVSLTNLDSSASQRIKSCYFGTQPIADVPTGLYTLTYSHSTHTLTLKKNIKKKAGGSHQDAWQLWENLIDKLSARSNLDPAEYANESLDLVVHRKFLVKSTGKFNPPDIRGEINYQFKGSSWIFEKSATASIRNIQLLISDSTSFQPLSSPTVEGLISNNKLIIALAKSIFLHSSEKYPKSICRSLSNKFRQYLAKP